jgi:Protein of unknown function (DUF4238)
MPEKKRQHYVPQSYLKLFSRDKQHLFLYHSESDKFFCSNVKDLCQAKYFYGSDLEVENSFGPIEDEQSKVLKKIIDQQSLDNLTDNDKLYLSLFLLLQHTRTKQVRDSTIEYTEDLINGHIAPRLGITSEVKVKFTGAHHNEMLVAWCGAELIGDFHPYLVLNNTEKSFICSDAPVVLYNYVKIRNEYLVGYQSPGLQIFCPINEKILLLLVDPLFYSVNAIDNYKIVLNDDSDVDEINKLQICNCLHNFFLSDESQLEDAKKLYFEVEKLKSSKRIEVSTYDRRYDKNSESTHEIIKFHKARINYKLKLSFLKLNHIENRKFQGMVRRSLKVNKLTVFSRDSEICNTVKSRIDDSLTRARERENSVLSQNNSL